MESPRRAVLWKDGLVTDLNTLLPTNSGWVLQDTVAINDHDQIVVKGRFKTTSKEAGLLQQLKM